MTPCRPVTDGKALLESVHIVDWTPSADNIEHHAVSGRADLPELGKPRARIERMEGMAD
jgi:hypothetical protein